MFFRFHLKVLTPKIYCSVLFITICFVQSFSQNNEVQDSIIDSYKVYANNLREVAYAHLNKSVFVKGETLAFTAYVFVKGDKKPSQLTSNLYCTISDENGKTIKSKMLLVTNGVSHGSFYVDSLFSSGNYTFKA